MSSTKEYIGFGNLPNQVHNNGVRHCYRYVVMVLGRSGLGKSTFVDALFGHDFKREEQDKSATAPYIRTVNQDMTERGVNLRLTVVDTPGYGDFIDNTGASECAEEYIKDQFKSYLSQEMRPRRGRLIDTRVHACIYFISPNSHGLRPLDIETMQNLQDLVNIIPVIGKSDTLTISERKVLKEKINRDLKEYGIRPFNPAVSVPIEEEGLEIDETGIEDKEKEDYSKHIPFAITTSREKFEHNGRTMRGRKYDWGVVDMDNDQHCDFVHLRNLVLRQHMNDLITTTNFLHYENFRESIIMQGRQTNAGDV